MDHYTLISRYKTGTLLFVLGIIIFCTNLKLSAQDYVDWCNAVQNNVGLIRYPLGTIGVTSTFEREDANAMTYVPLIYPCQDSVKIKKANESWVSDITGDPSHLVIQYNDKMPSGGSKTEITVTPHVSVHSISFSAGHNGNFLVLDFSTARVDDWARLYKWTERKITRINDSIFEATVGEPGKAGAFYYIKFSEPVLEYCTFDSSGKINRGASSVEGDKLGIYGKFKSSTVTVAIAESFTSMDKSKYYLASEFSNFDTAWKQCHQAWNSILGKVEIEAPDNNKRMAYTALYTMLVNTIAGDDGSCYLPYYQHPKTIASSLYWQFIGGFQSCCWDNYRTVYPFMMLAYPDIMDDVVSTYLARYQKYSFVAGNTCLFTGPTGGHESVRFTSVLAAEARANNLNVDHKNLYSALRDNYNNPKYVPVSLRKLGYETQPATGGKSCSETLEWSTSFYAMAQLAKWNNDQKNLGEYEKLSKSYANVWDSTNCIFRVKDEKGQWGPMVKKSGLDSKNWTWNPNPQGLFEGTSLDWMFSVPHDPYGLINLPGQKDLVDRIVQYCEKDTWFNDYQYHYPYLLYYAGAPNQSQRIIRKIWVPLFNKGVLYEGVSPDSTYHAWKTHYTSDAGWLMSSMLGLYPVPSPAGQFIISSPSVTRAVIYRGDKTITIQTHNNSDKNIYIASIKLNGKQYPGYLIPSSKTRNATIDLQMTSDSTVRLGNIYLSSTDGYVESAELISEKHLKCVIEAAVDNATSEFYCDTRPARVLVNGKLSKKWGFNSILKTVTIQSSGKTTIEIVM